MKNKLILLVILSIFFAQYLLAQVNIGIGFYWVNSDGWETAGVQISPSLEIPKNGASFILNYRLTPFQKRVEFLPELRYSLSTLNNTEESITYVEKHDHLSFSTSTNFYLFDFEGDCGCPTFSKKGGLLKKGFFIQLSPGVSLINRSLDIQRGNEEITTKDETKVTFHIGVGLGVDIGLNDQLTLSPFVRYVYLPKQNWEGFNFFTGNSDSVSISKFLLAISLQYNF